MAVDPSRNDGPHELRLEGFRLVASVIGVGGLLLTAVVGAFLLGRWVERRSHPGASMADERGPLAEVQAAEPLDADLGLTYFDDLQGEEQEAEPGREIPGERPEAATPAVRSLDPALAAPDDVEMEDGPFYIQVFAGRDRSSAEELVGRLQSGGYRVRLFSERDGPGSLFKVRVGGYPADARAREVADELKAKGYSGAWVARSD